jgi:hypothetical protein
MRSIDPDDVYAKALARPAGVDDLDEHELLVYAVKELETYIAMSGWEGFFTGSCSTVVRVEASALSVASCARRSTRARCFCIRPSSPTWRP